VIEERNRLARELHDSVTQKLFGIVLTAEAAGTLLDQEPERARGQLQRLQELAGEAMEELRSLIFELRPGSLEGEGLATTLRKHVDVLRRVHGREIVLEVAGAPKLAPAVEAEVFRIAQEALHNALRHSGAQRLELSLRAREGGMTLTVTDDGVGFDPEDPALRSRRLGLTSMQERARALGTALRIDSRPGEGTTIALEVAS
jgi:signal transduction histidine kinase